MATDDELLAHMLPVLEIDLQVVRHFPPHDKDGIAQFRRVGRKAVHQLGHRASTMQSDSARRPDGLVAVVVAALAGEEHPDAKRIHERSIELIRRTDFPGGDA